MYIRVHVHMCTCCIYGTCNIIKVTRLWIKYKQTSQPQTGKYTLTQTHTLYRLLIHTIEEPLPQKY